MITKLGSTLKKNIQLQPHQQDFVDKLDNTDALLAYHGLGSGKTLSSIAGTLAASVDTVVPAALRENYKKELAKFVAGPSTRNVVSYEGASRGGLKYSTKPDNALVIDEIQRIGNSGTKRSKVLRDIASFYDKRILLSGTPAQNSPSELAPILKMLNPDDKSIPVSSAEFNKKFIRQRTVSPTIMQRLRGIRSGVVDEGKNLGIFRSALTGKVHYHDTGTDQFPQRIDQVHKVEMSPEQREIYRVVTEKANPVLRRKILSGMPLSKQESTQLNAFMTAARQVSNTTTPYGGSERLSPKLKSVIANIMKNRKDKHVVYSNYLDSGINVIGDELKRTKTPFTSFTGKLNDKEKAQAVNDYNSGKVKNLLLSSAGAEGIDLKGTRNIHLLEPHWNKSKIEQVIGRGIRFGSHTYLPASERNVNVHKYQSVLPKTWWQKLMRKPADTSADTYLEDLSERKQSLLDQFLNIMKAEGGKR